jgi:glycosyltransferase involved in cell wall biosynthesis
LNIVVNAVSTRTGGGLTYLRQLLPPLGSKLAQAGATLHVLLNADAGRQLSDILAGSSIMVNTPRWASGSGLKRQLSEQTLLSGALESLSANAVFHIGDTAPLRSNIPSILLCRNMLLYSPKGTHTARLRVLRLLARKSVEQATAVAFVSQTLADHVLSQCTPAKWAIIHHGPGLTPGATRRPPGHRPIALIVVGSLYTYKRVELAIAAVAELRKRNEVATLEIVGRPIEAPYAARLRRQVEDLGLIDRVRFVGEASASRMMDAYADASIALVTSANESFCHPILEALHAGMPVVAPSDLAVAQEIAGQAAIYAEPTARAFADAVQHLVQEPARASQIVEAGLLRVNAFSWDTTAKQTAELLLSCTS